MLFVSGLSGIAEASFIIYKQETAFTNAASVAGVSLSFESFEGLTAINSEDLDTVTVDDFTITGPESSLGVFNVYSGGAIARTVIIMSKRIRGKASQRIRLTQWNLLRPSGYT